MEGQDRMSLSIAMTNLRVSASSGFTVSAGVSLGVSSSMGSACADWCVDWFDDDMGMGVGGCDRV